jgi:hypothetical protein
VFEHLADAADNEYAMIDSTIVRAHRFCQISRHRLWRARAGLTIWPALMAGWMGCGA